MLTRGVLIAFASVMWFNVAGLLATIAFVSVYTVGSITINSIVASKSVRKQALNHIKKMDLIK